MAAFAFARTMKRGRPASRTRLPSYENECGEKSRIADDADGQAEIEEPIFAGTDARQFMTVRNLLMEEFRPGDKASTSSA